MAGSAGNPKYYNVSEIKSRVLNIAQTSVYHVKFAIPNPVRAFLSSKSIDYNQISDIELLCSETSLPGTSLATQESQNDFHGVTEQMVHRRIYDDTLNLTFYVDRDYRVIEFFDSWIDFIVGQGTSNNTFSANEYSGNYVHYRMSYPSTYKENIHIVKFEKEFGTSMKYSFINAFPKSITSMPVSYEQSQLLKCNVSFSYIRYVRERYGDGKIGTIPDPRSPAIAEQNSLNFDGNAGTTNILGNNSTDLERLRAASAAATLLRSRNGLGERVLEGRGRSQDGQRVGDFINNAF